MQSKKTPKFPARFLWGASISAHQTEGDLTNQWTEWESDNAKVRASQAQYHYQDLEAWPDIKGQATRPGNYISGKGISHHLHFKDDISLVRKLNLNTLRFSIEWSRVEPQQGAWSVEGIQYYKEYIAELERYSIEPVVTFFHFSLPVWFTDIGGFEKRSNVAYFTRFVEKMMNEFGSSVRYIITINEPQTYANESYLQQNWPPAAGSKRRFFTVLNNLIYAHNKTARMLHAMNRRYRVAIAHDTRNVYPGDDAILSRASSRIIQFMSDDYVLRRVKRNSDFIGVNYHFSSRVYGYRVHNEDKVLSDIGWDMHPDHLEYVLERLHDVYKLPIIVTENGLADANDTHRKWWLGKTMIALSNALENGVEVRGYLHGTLLDGFELTHGYWPRFGLVEVSQETGKRTIRPSALWWARIIKKIRE